MTLRERQEHRLTDQSLNLDSVRWADVHCDEREVKLILDQEAVHLSG
jgi:hypothetical protein